MMVLLGWMADGGRPMVCMWEADADRDSYERAKEYVKHPASAEGMRVYHLPTDEPYPYHRVRDAMRDNCVSARTTKSLQRWDFDMNDIGAPNKDTLRREGKLLWHDKVQDMYQWNGQVFYITQKGAVHYFLYQ